MKNTSWPGIALIILGGMLLLDHTHIISVSWRVLLWGAVAAAGIIMVVRGFAPSSGNGGVFWGTLIAVLGLVQFFARTGLAEIPSALEVPFIFFALGLAMLLVFARNPRDWHLLVPALAFLCVGAAVLLAELDLFSRWDVRDVVSRFWPIALILFGLALLLNRRGARA